MQGVVDTLFKDYCTVVKQNQHLKDQLKCSEKSSCEHIDQIAALRHENKKLNGKINCILNAQNEHKCDSFEIICQNKRINDCENEIEALKQKLAKKDKVIERLLFKNRSQSTFQKCGSSEPTIGSNSIRNGKCLLRTRSDDCASYRSWTSNSLSESEKRDTKMIQVLENGYKELSKILKKRYDQVRNQRATIDELTKQLEKFAGMEPSMERLCREKEHLENQLKNLQKNVDSLNKMNKQFEKCTSELEQLKRHELVNDRKFTAQDEHIATLSAERKNLMKINNEMQQSIRLCERELSKYCN